MTAQRAVPGTDLANDPGREGERQPMKSLKGGMAAPNVQQPLSGGQTGSPARDRSNDTWEQSPFAGPPGNANSTYTGAA